MVRASLTLTLAAPPGAAQTPKRGGIRRIAEREAPSGHGLDLRLMYTWLDR